MMMPMNVTHGSPRENPSSGARLVATDGRVLPLVGAALKVDARGGVARVILEQRFRNPHEDPLAVTYSLPMPEDGAVSGFSFAIGDVLVVGEVDRKQTARERYEQALSEGRSAALLEQDRGSLFTQEVGNIPPGAEVVATIEVDQRLRWLDEGAWEWRFPTVVAPRYMGAPGRVADIDKVTQDISDGPIAARIGFSCTIRDALVSGRRPESPSHTIQARDDVSDTGVAMRIELEGERARLDRDVVIRWPVSTPKVGMSLDVGRPHATGRRSSIASSTYGLLTLVPPERASKTQPVSRDLIVLLDTSGSMGGEPLDQATRVVSAMIDTLSDRDQIELIEFSTAARRWKAKPVAATSSNRKEAITWLRNLRASGSTEMRDGILAAMQSLRAESQRQVVLITDGMIGFETEVVKAIVERLPPGSRVHTVGVGSAVNRSLTGPAARAGHGVEVIIGIGEDPERAARRIVTRTDAPLVVDLQLSGDALEDQAPQSLPDLFAGSPALISVKLKAQGGSLMVRGRTATGAWEQRISVRAIGEGVGNSGLAALYAREKVEDLEMKIASGMGMFQVDPQIERVGVDFQIATRLTSWIAVSREVMVDPRDALRRERMPHELALGLSAEGVGLRPAASTAAAPPSTSTYEAKTMIGIPPSFAQAFAPSPAPAPAPPAMPMGPSFGGFGGAPPPPAPPPAAAPYTERQREASNAPARGAAPADGRVSGKIDLKSRMKKADMAPSPASPAQAGGAPPAPPPSFARFESPTTGEAEDEAYGAIPTYAPEARRAPIDDVEEAPEKPSLIRRMKRFFGLERDERAEQETSVAPPRVEPSTEAPHELAKEERPRPAPTSTVRTLEARLVKRTATEMLIELTIDSFEIAWAPGSSVEVVWDDGSTSTIAVDESRTTRVTTLKVGQSARLTLRTGALDGARSPREIRVLHGADQLILRLA